MNILTGKLPDRAEIDGVEYLINTDYRVALKIMAAFEDEELTDREKLLIMLKLLYPVQPPNTVKAVELAKKFLDCGEDIQETSESRKYSFTKDAKYIYTGIQQTHGVDLQKVDLHWWQFVYLFMDLSADCMMSKIIDLRIRREKGTLSPEEKAYCLKIEDALEIPTAKVVENEAASDFMRRLRGEIDE